MVSLTFSGSVLQASSTRAQQGVHADGRGLRLRLKEFSSESVVLALAFFR